MMINDGARDSYSKRVSNMETTTKKARSLYIPYAGPVLLEFPLLNKGSAFSVEERRNFNLSGLLPEVVESIEEQAERAWLQYQGFKTEIDKHIYLRNIRGYQRNALLSTGAKPS